MNTSEFKTGSSSVAMNTRSIGSFNKLNNRKRRAVSDDEDEILTENFKKSKYNSWYVTLERESSTSLDEDEESIYTLQGYETERARDTPDISTNYCGSSDSDIPTNYCSSSELNRSDVEYEVDSDANKEDDLFVIIDSSTDPENIMHRVIAARDSDGIAEDSDVSTTSSDNDDSRNSNDYDVRKAIFSTCAQCRVQINSFYRYCDNCYKKKKEHSTPRTRPRRKCRPNRMNSFVSLTSLETSSTRSLNLMDSRTSIGLTKMDSIHTDNQSINKVSDSYSFKTPNNKQDLSLIKNKFSLENHVELQSAESDCSVLQLSQDSGMGSSQDFEKLSSDLQSHELKNDKSTISNSIKDRKDETVMETSHSSSNPASSSNTLEEEPSSNSSQEQIDDLCLFCQENRKNAGFPHSKIIHVCCCYECAKKVWKSNGNRCPICNQRVTVVQKLFYS